MIMPGRGRLVHEQRQHVEQASEIGGRPMGEDEGDDGDLLRRHVGSDSVRSDDVTGYESANKVISGW